MEVKRATFEQVNKWQLDFLFGTTGIQTLEEKEETVDPKSRRDFFDLFAKSLLGKAIDYDFILEYNGDSYNLGNLSIFARKMSYMTDTKDKKQILKLKGKQISIPIKLLWKSLRENMYKPMDQALTMALKISAEILKNSSGSYEFNPDQE